MTGKKSTRVKEKNKSFWETIPGILTGIAAILTAIGSLIATLVTVGVIQINPKYPQPALITQSPNSTPKIITITLENKNCFDQDFYVDDIKVVTIKSGDIGTFQTTPGEHNTYACIPGTKTCAVSSRFNWVDSTSHFINAGAGCVSTLEATPSLILVTLTNKTCHDEDFYVDGKKAVTVKAESQEQFLIPAGEHDTKVCDTVSKICGENIKVNWQNNISPIISRGSDCP